MDKRKAAARSLIVLGCLIVLAGSAIHLLLAYPKVSAALASSNLEGKLPGALRSVFFMIALTWTALAAITLIATFSKASFSKPIVLFCGFTLLAMVPAWVSMMGWFVGNEMFVAAGALVVGGGALLRSRHSI